jgi:hypothetical protein
MSSLGRPLPAAAGGTPSDSNLAEMLRTRTALPF